MLVKFEQVMINGVDLYTNLHLTSKLTRLKVKVKDNGLNG